MSTASAWQLLQHLTCVASWNMRTSMAAASRLLAAVMAWMSPVMWRLNSSMGTTCRQGKWVSRGCTSSPDDDLKSVRRDRHAAADQRGGAEGTANAYHKRWQGPRLGQFLRSCYNDSTGMLVEAAQVSAVKSGEDAPSCMTACMHS